MFCWIEAGSCGGRKHDRVSLLSTSSVGMWWTGGWVDVEDSMWSLSLSADADMMLLRAH
jgi:hypothetical protein